MYEILKDQYEMYGTSVKPVKASAMRWINYQLHAMDYQLHAMLLVDKQFAQCPLKKM